MSTPKKKQSKSRKNIRKGTHKLQTTELKACTNCKKPTKPHTVCKYCKTYNK